MKIYELQEPNHVAAVLLTIWEDSVTADASFSVGHRDRTDPGICSTGVTKCVPSACCTNESGESIGFMGTENNRLECCFFRLKNVEKESESRCCNMAWNSMASGN